MLCTNKLQLFNQKYICWELICSPEDTNELTASYVKAEQLGLAAHFRGWKAIIPFLNANMYSAELLG